MRHTLLCLGLVVAAIVVGALPASAIRSTTGFHLDLPGTGSTTVATWATSALVSSSRSAPHVRPIVDVSMFGATVDSWLYVHDCGTPPDLSRPAANYVTVGETRKNLVPLDGTA